MQTRSRNSGQPRFDAVGPITLAGASRFWPRNVLVVCLFVQTWLLVLHFHLALHAVPAVRVLGQAFDMTRESSVATYLSALLALATGLVCLVVAGVLRKSGAKKLRTRGWCLAGGVFVFISIDDAVAFHEKIGSITSLDLVHSLNYPSYPWHITVAPLLAVALLVGVIFVWRDIRRIGGLTPMLILAVACFALALGLDFYEGIKEMASMAAQEAVPGSEHLPLVMLTEEMLEMIGTSLFLYVVFAYLAYLSQDIRWSWRSDSAEATGDSLRSAA